MTTHNPSRRLAILLTTPASANDPRRYLGSADYSYGFVERALRPVLASIGSVRLVDRPESRLSWAAAAARAENLVPVHLSLSPLQGTYIVPDVPTVAFPFWEFPRIPDRDFGHDTRQNWTRIVHAMDRIVCACHFTADAFRASCRVPVDVIPVPIDSRSFDVAAWNHTKRVKIDCRHLLLSEEAPSALDDAVPAWNIPSHVRRLYNNGVRPLLSKQALERMKRLRRRLLHMPDLPPRRLPVSRLELSGLTYLSIFNFSDRRKNARDMLTAFLLAFRDRADVTLVWKLATNPHTAADELDQLRALHASFGLRHRCRVVVIADYLDDETLGQLYEGCTYYLNASRGEGACLPLQQALATGTPAIAPACSAMRDYIDGDVGFPVAHSQEPTYWPHDPEKRVETSWARLSWASLRDCLIASARVADQDPVAYRALSTSARERMRTFSDSGAIANAWRRVFDAA